MANKSLFARFKSLFPRATARNQEGGLAYALPPKHALAQIAATGCFNGTFYAEAEDQLETLRALIAQVNDNQFLAEGMKDRVACFVASHILGAAMVECRTCTRRFCMGDSRRAMFADSPGDVKL